MSTEDSGGRTAEERTVLQHEPHRPRHGAPDGGAASAADATRPPDAPGHAPGSAVSGPPREAATDPAAPSAAPPADRPQEPPGGRYERPALDEQGRREALQRSGADGAAASGSASGSGSAPGASATPTPTPTAATAATTGAGAAAGTPVEPRTTVLPTDRRPERPTRAEPRPTPRPAPRAVGRSRRARLVVKRVDPWSVFLFSLVASICLGIVLLVAVATLYFVLENLGVLSSVNTVLGEVLGGTGPEEVAEPFFTSGRVLGATAVLAAVDVVLLTVLATLGALLYNLCASLTGGIEVMLGERD